jgi:hypothetical protein
MNSRMPTVAARLTSFGNLAKLVARRRLEGEASMPYRHTAG